MDTTVFPTSLADLLDLIDSDRAKHIDLGDLESLLPNFERRRSVLDRHHLVDRAGWSRVGVAIGKYPPRDVRRSGLIGKG